MTKEEIRRKIKSSEIDELRNSIVSKHKTCKGKGFIEILEKHHLTGFPIIKVEPCRCLKKFNFYSRMILSGVIPERVVNQQLYKKKVVDKISFSEVDLISEIITPCLKKIRKFSRNPYGFLFLGKNGTGKTFIGLKILYHALASSLTAHCINFLDLLKLLRKNFDGEIDLLISEILDVDILMIDELGNESVRSDFSISELKSIIKQRVDRKKPTIIVSNYIYDDFKSIYGASIESVVEAYFRVFDFNKVVNVRKARRSVEIDAFFKALKGK